MMRISSLALNGISIMALSLGIAAMPPAFAGTQQELATAIKHAGFAAQATPLKKVHVHLQHVINCLEGPNGADFDGSVGNPCKGQGNGLLNDMGSNKSEQKSMIKRVRDLALTGIKVDVLEPAQDIGKASNGILKATQSALQGSDM